jgi:mRNA interferase MazF
MVSAFGKIVGFPITHTTHINKPFQFELSGHKISGHVILTGLLGYDYLAQAGKTVDHVSTKELFQARRAVKDIFGFLD